jgi:hypothetical protein
MIRRFLYELLLFLLPFALYAAYLRVSRRENFGLSRDHPWTMLFASGLLLVAASFLYLGLVEGAGQSGTYVPPHVENGRVVPGHVEPAK